MLNIQKAINTKSYYILRSYYNFIKDYTNKKPFLFVHQMGKVGSSTIINSLKKINYDKTANIYWTHFLSNDGVKFLENLEIKGFGEWDSFPSNIKSMIANSYVLSNVIQKNLLSIKKCKIITLIRDPIAVNVSGFFQNYKWWPKNILKEYKYTENSNLANLFNFFFNYYSNNIPIIWFDSEIKNVFGIDVFESAFPKTKGYKVYKKNNIELLFIRLESLNSISKEVFSSFLNLSEFSLLESNISKQKWYNSLYVNFKNSIEFPDGYIDQIYNSKLVRHFYNNDEISNFKYYWSKSKQNLNF